jgi:hypothetical protein
VPDRVSYPILHFPLDNGVTRFPEMDQHLGRMPSPWFLSPDFQGNLRYGARPSNGRHPPTGTFPELKFGATRTEDPGPIRWMADVHTIPR